MLSLVGRRKVRVSREGVRAFNRTWPCSSLRDTRAYWFEFDSNGDLVDTDVPEQDDSRAAVAMSHDCQAWLEQNVMPDWVK